MAFGHSTIVLARRRNLILNSMVALFGLTYFVDESGLADPGRAGDDDCGRAAGEAHLGDGGSDWGWEAENGIIFVSCLLSDHM